jgi:hypothetical protein
LPPDSSLTFCSPLPFQPLTRHLEERRFHRENIPKVAGHLSSDVYDGFYDLSVF